MFRYVCILAITLAPWLGAQENNNNYVLVRGKVVDDRGRPVTDARVSVYWGTDKGKPRNYKVTTSNKEGAFEARFRVYLNKFSLMAYSSDSKFSGTVDLVRAEKVEGVVVRLSPSARLAGEFVATDRKKPLKWTNLYLHSLPSGWRGWQCARQKKFDIPVPPGKYELLAYGNSTKFIRRKIILEPGKRLDLGKIDLGEVFLSRNAGKPITWRVTEARGVAVQKASVESFRGKWLFVEFWGHW